MIVKINKKELIFSGWELQLQEQSINNIWVRHLILDDGPTYHLSRIGIMPSWKDIVYSSDDFNYKVFFWGSEISFLNDIYCRVYPLLPLLDGQRPWEAKQHLDNFMNKASSLMAFI